MQTEIGRSFKMPDPFWPKNKLWVVVASEPVRVPKLIKFGEDFELDAESYTLRHARSVLKLERIPIEILRCWCGSGGS
jgi:hypothetical protein